MLDMMNDAIDYASGAFGRSKTAKRYPKKKMPHTKPRKDFNPFVRCFNKMPMFRAIFNDPELDFIDPMATVMFFISAIMLIMCVPVSLTRGPWSAFVQKRLGRVGTWFLWAADCAFRTYAVVLSLFCLWIPLNSYVHHFFAVADKNDYGKEYLTDPENYKPVITNDKMGQVLPSFVLACLSLTAALMMSVRRLQTVIADDPEAVAREMELKRKHAENIICSGSGDMPPPTKEEIVPEPPTRVRKTPLRSCRLRSSFGRDSTDAS